MSKKLHARYLFSLSQLSTVILLLGAAFALLNSGSLPLPVGAAQARFDDLSVVGPPSLPAATVMRQKHLEPRKSAAPFCYHRDRIKK